MVITGTTKIEELLSTYPFLEDFMPSISKEYRLLKNKLVRKTVGRFATLDKVAAIGGVSLESLLEQVAQKVRQATGDDILGVSGDPAHKQKREKIKTIIRGIHDGRDAKELIEEFRDVIADIGAYELSQVEQELIQEGLPVEEVQGLCNIHSHVFEEGLKSQSVPGVPAGHPAHTMMLENRELEKRIAAARESASDPAVLIERLGDLAQIEMHYLRKENQLFPQLEQKGITGPSQVMWGKHNEIRKLLKAARERPGADTVEPFLRELEEMITKEEKILIPMALEVLPEAAWVSVREGEAELGYAWIKPVDRWNPEGGGADIVRDSTEVGEFKLDVGHLSPQLLNLMLCHLPVDLSMVNEHDEVVYYNQPQERVFPRSPGVIGRKVQNCHPQSSVHVVNRILDSFRVGEQDCAEFWLQMKGKFLHIRYFAVRDSHGTYKGCLEVSQNVTGIRALTGERRLLDWS